MDYLSKDQELEVMRKMSNLDFKYQPKVILTLKDIHQIQKEINQITISETLEKYIIELVFATRNPAEYGLTQEANYIQFGASPRASIHLNLASKVLAYLEGRDYVLPEDIKEMAPDVLNHRIILNYEAEADDVTTLQIIQTILSSVAINR
jgi:MoxR-like ATPase